jgi:hypothetical protein
VQWWTNRPQAGTIVVLPGPSPGLTPNVLKERRVEGKQPGWVVFDTPILFPPLLPRIGGEEGECGEGAGWELAGGKSISERGKLRTEGGKQQTEQGKTVD